MNSNQNQFKLDYKSEDMSARTSYSRALNYQ